ncbi:putative retinol dehydrogenase 8 [Apostichopus japonicus]|uniref:Putative retinol dehydrogenase 8 n=1 Tax=Stichopus japonicus TaxID=307972 RepID=A0A2G8KZF9_STIJA|nr:putative retinol dehydrogenase 8 [Apostichopus japonicus]
MGMKVVVISGCSSGIGLATAVMMAKDSGQRYKVFATMRNLSKKTDLEISAGDQLGKTLFIKELDVSKEESVKKFAEDILESEGRVDILINNAGYGQAATLENASLEKSRQLFETNFFGAMHLTQKFIPSMKRNKSGHIIFISSTVTTFGIPFCEVYTASKCALNGLAETLAPQLALFNVKVSIVCPGPVGTKFAPNMAIIDDAESDTETKAVREKYMKTLTEFISGNLQTGEEVAAVVQEAIQAEKPDFRYYTSPKDLQSASTKYSDTTGNGVIQFVSKLYFKDIKVGHSSD